jgi:hypothetical protein
MDSIANKEPPENNDPPQAQSSEQDVTVSNDEIMQRLDTLSKAIADLDKTLKTSVQTELNRQIADRQLISHPEVAKTIEQALVPYPQLDQVKATVDARTNGHYEQLKTMISELITPIISAQDQQRLQIEQQRIQIEQNALGLSEMRTAWKARDERQTRLEASVDTVNQTLQELRLVIVGDGSEQHQPLAKLSRDNQKDITRMEREQLSSAKRLGKIQDQLVRMDTVIAEMNARNERFIKWSFRLARWTLPPLLAGLGTIGSFVLAQLAVGAH